MSIDYLLHESSVGYAIFQVVHQPDVVGNRMKEFQESLQDLARFGKMVKLISFAPFQGAAQALENANRISEGIAPQFLLSTIEVNLPKSSKITLGVADRNLAGALKGAFPHLQCETGDTSEVVQDMLRGIRLHAHKLLKQLQEGDVERAQLGLGHAYSRSRVKFSVQKNDNHIIQAIATLDHLDKSINMFSMRVREWYGWHFPELIRIVSENHQYAKMALFIGDKKRLNDRDLDALTAQCNDDAAIAQSILDAAKVSMGQDLSETDLENVMTFSKRVVSLAVYRKALYDYLVGKMGVVAPNLAALLGEVIAARLISHAGSLTNLSKYPASTVQILGAEKALFRALKTKGNTPKYGLLYHSSFIGRAGQRNKGRISRFLQPTTKFGNALKAQVEERLKFYDSGVAPTKNEVAMRSAMDAVLAEVDVEDSKMDVDVDREELVEEPSSPIRQKQGKQKREKKDRKDKEERRARKEEKRKRHGVKDGHDEADLLREKKKKKRKSKTEEAA
ncbi:MAG: Nucleolar protein 56 [Ramalina farinacea]|uniref:Nucleolar protein 56 n=1 Tax=Ramalina farinacea TaxID=258253 RepID=A0AA43QEH1_9LECA|nr:Nucleolar protein 56 [Ramalina farinacea]